MGKTTIEITGTLGKNIKVNPDGTAEVLMMNTMSTGVPKGLKTLGSTNYLVQIGVKAWKKLSSQASEDCFVRIYGEPKASVTKAGVPYIHVIAFNVVVIDLNENNTKTEPQDTIEREQHEATNKVSTDINATTPTQSTIESIKVFKPISVGENNQWAAAETVKWFEHPEIMSNYIKVDVSKIVLTEKEHLKTKLPSKYISRKNSDKLVMVVRPLEDGTFSLTVGFLNLIIAKLYNIPVSAFVFDGNKEQLIETYNVTAF